MSTLPGIDHPRFTRLNKTHYVVTNPDSVHQWYIHVGQIMDYLAFDKYVRTHGSINGFPGVPTGFLHFALAFNTGKYPSDKRSISTVFIDSTLGDDIHPAENPVFLENFYITPEQCGLSSPRNTGVSEAQAYVFEEYATMHATRNKRKREAFQERENKRHSLFGRFGQSRHHDPIGTTMMDRFGTESDDHSMFIPSTTSTTTFGTRHVKTNSRLTSGSTTTPTTSTSTSVLNPAATPFTSTTTPTTYVRLPRAAKGKANADHPNKSNADPMIE
jgi:hypothetical protein